LELEIQIWKATGDGFMKMIFARTISHIYGVADKGASKQKAAK
jgi:hypothetical protein